VADEVAFPGVFEFTTDQLALGGPEDPHLILGSVAFGLATALAFDSSGNLWVGTSGVPGTGGVVQEFQSNVLAGSGSVTPDPWVTISPNPLTHYSLTLTGMAFDNEGNLWIADEDNYALNWGDDRVEKWSIAK
jgi:hypothetical protein